MVATKTQPATAAFAKSTSSFGTEFGRIIRVEAGEAWLSTNPAVQHRPDMFSKTPLVQTSDRGWVALEDI